HNHFVNEAERRRLRIRGIGLENAAWAAFKCHITLDSTVREMPSWLTPDNIDAKTSHGYIAFQNGILDIRAKSLIEHTPQWFSPICLPFNYDPQQRCDVWLRTLDEIFQGDQERIALLQEWFGYCLTPDTSYHVFMLFEGESRAGKGTIKDVLVQLIGRDNTSSVRLEMFG